MRLTVRTRDEGEIVHDGLTITRPSVGRLHIVFQFKTNGVIQRLRLKIPRAWENLTYAELLIQLQDAEIETWPDKVQE